MAGWGGWIGGSLLVSGLIGLAGWWLWRRRDVGSSATDAPDESVGELSPDLAAEREHRRRTERCRQREQVRYQLPTDATPSLLPWRTRRITRRHLRRARPVLKALIEKADPVERSPKRLPRPGFYSDRRRLF